MNLSPIPVSATYYQWPFSWASVSEIWSLHLDSMRSQDLLGWVLGSIKDASWAECGNLALKELPNEIYFCLSKMGHFKVKVLP